MAKHATAVVVRPPTNDHSDPQTLARAAADAYFAALATQIPFDHAPGEVNLGDECTRIEMALDELGTFSKFEDERELIARRAGYLLGVEIGRRLGGAR